MTRASFFPSRGCNTGLLAYRSPLPGVACPLREMRASTTTLSNCESRREGSIAMESSRRKLTGHVAAVVRRTAQWGPRGVGRLGVNEQRGAALYAGGKAAIE